MVATSSGINPAGRRLGQAAMRPDPFPKVFGLGSEEAISKRGRGITLNLSSNEQHVSCRRLPSKYSVNHFWPPLNCTSVDGQEAVTASSRCGFFIFPNGASSMSADKEYPEA